MSRFQEGYFESMKNQFAEEKARQERISLFKAEQNARKNQRFVRVVKGTPMNIYTDSCGNVLDIEVCKDMDYKTRAEIHGQDPLAFEKYCNGAFRHSTVDATILTSVKGTPVDTALEVLSNLK